MLAYNESCPMNNEVTFLHLSENIPLRTVNLGSSKFICFVGHPKKVEQLLFEQENEKFCDVMFLIRQYDEVKKRSLIKLVSLKQDPWKDEAHYFYKD